MTYPHGSLFTLECLKERVHQRIRALAGRTRRNLSTLAVQSTRSGGQMASQASETLTIGQSLLKDLQAAELVRRLVVDLDRGLAAQPEFIKDVMLRDGDHLRIPEMPQDVTAIGEAQNTTSHLYSPSLTRDDYLSTSAGGPTRSTSASCGPVAVSMPAAAAGGSGRAAI
jgi:hypothetical protein